MPITIRQGVEADLPRVLELVRELAAYEKCSAEVTNTLEGMRADGFGPRAVFGFFVADDGPRIIGMALYYTKYSTWKGRCLFMEDLIVTESHRGRGVGQRLLSRVARLARDTGDQRLEWQVLNWNEPAIAFYKKLGAAFDNRWVNVNLTPEQLERYERTNPRQENA